jgi:hypothetical protein
MAMTASTIARIPIPAREAAKILLGDASVLGAMKKRNYGEALHKVAAGGSIGAPPGR